MRERRDNEARSAAAGFSLRLPELNYNMKLNVNPNRMELLRLRRRLALAERGHKLLKDKLEEIMRRFLETIRRLSALQAEVSAGLDRIFVAFALASGRNSAEEMAGSSRTARSTWPRGGRASSASPSLRSPSRASAFPITISSRPRASSTSA